MSGQVTADDHHPKASYAGLCKVECVIVYTISLSWLAYSKCACKCTRCVRLLTVQEQLIVQCVWWVEIKVLWPGGDETTRWHEVGAGPC